MGSSHQFAPQVHANPSALFRAPTKLPLTYPNLDEYHSESERDVPSQL